MSFIKNLELNRGYQYLITSRSFKRKNRLKALAELSYRNKLNSEEACFLYFRLGMYRSVINHPYKGNGWRGNIAKSVSYAALGEFEEALKNVDQLRNCLNLTAEIKRRLACELAAYMPEISLQIIEEVAPNTIFHLALLMKLNEFEKVKQILEVIGQNNVEVDFYRLSLQQEGRDKLESLNRIFKYYLLEPVQLININQLLSANNIEGMIELPDIQGPLISVLVTTHNSSEFIHTAINSLLAQSYSNIEIIIIDDASTDNTVEIINAYAQRDRRIKVLTLTKNVGTFIAKTQGIKIAQGEFVTCHDSDDWAHPRKIELQAEPLLRDEHLIFTTSQWIRMQKNGNLYARKVYPLLRLNPASPMFRKNIVLARAGYWDQVRTGADSEFLERLKIVFGPKSMQQIKKPLTIGAHRDGSLMTDGFTGYSSLEGSKKRIEYLESWQNKHLNMVKKLIV